MLSVIASYWRYHLSATATGILIYLSLQTNYVQYDPLLVDLSVSILMTPRRVYTELRRPDVMPLLFGGFRDIYPVGNDRDETEWRKGQNFTAKWATIIGSYKSSISLQSLSANKQLIFISDEVSSVAFNWTILPSGTSNEHSHVHVKITSLKRSWTAYWIHRPVMRFLLWQDMRSRLFGMQYTLTG